MKLQHSLVLGIFLNMPETMALKFQIQNHFASDSLHELEKLASRAPELGIIQAKLDKFKLLQPRLKGAYDDIDEITKPIPEPVVKVIHHKPPPVVIQHVVDKPVEIWADPEPIIKHVYDKPKVITHVVHQKRPVDPCAVDDCECDGTLPACNKFEEIVRKHQQKKQKAVTVIHHHQGKQHHVIHQTVVKKQEEEKPDLETRVLAGAALDKIKEPEQELKDMAQKALDKINNEEQVNKAAAAGAVAGIAIGGRQTDPEIQSLAKEALDKLNAAGALGNGEMSEALTNAATEQNKDTPPLNEDTPVVNAAIRHSQKAAPAPAQSTVQKAQNKQPKEDDTSIEEIASKAMEQVDAAESENMNRLTEAADNGFKQTQGQVDAHRDEENEKAEIAEKELCDKMKEQVKDQVKEKLAPYVAANNPDSPLTAFLNKEKIKEVEEKEIKKIQDKESEQKKMNKKGFIDNRKIYEKAYDRASAKLTRFDSTAREQDQQIEQYVNDHKEAMEKDVNRAEKEKKEIKSQIKQQDEELEKINDQSERAVKNVEKQAEAVVYQDATAEDETIKGARESVVSSIQAALKETSQANISTVQTSEANEFPGYETEIYHI